MTMEVGRKIAVVSAGFALLWAASLSAGEKVQFRGSTSIALPKPTRSLEDARSVHMSEGPSGQGEYESNMPAGGTPATNPQVDKKLKEFLDKKKNWIFVNPYEDNYDAKTEEFMKGEKDTGLYEHRLLKEEDKGVMEKYLEERSPYREEEADPESRGRDAERGPNGEVQRANERASERANEERPEPVANSLNLQQPVDRGLTFSTDQKTPALFGNGNAYEQKPERGGLSDRPLTFSERTDRGLSKDEMRKERDTRDAEITRMIQPRDTSAGVASRLAPVKSGDTSRPQGSPGGSQRTDSFLNANRPPTAAGGISGVGNSPIFSGGARPGGLSARPGFDFGPRASSSAGNSFGGGSISAPIAGPKPVVNNQPFVLPRPQRKF